MKKFFNIHQIKKHFKKGITPLLCALTIFNALTLNTAALSDTPDYIFEMHFAEPYVSGTSGYVIATRKVTNYTDYFYIWEAMYKQTADVENLQGNSLEDALSVNVTFRDSGISLTALSNVGCSFVVYEIPNWAGNTGIVQTHRVQLQPRVSQTLNFPWGFEGATTPYGYVYGKYYNINKGNTNLNTTVVFYDDYRVFDQINTIRSNLQTMINNQNAINNSINNMNVNLGNIANLQNNNLISIKNLLSSILNETSNGSIQDVSSSGITSVENKENALVGNNASTSELSVNINPLASSVVWNLVDTVVTSNAKVFTMFISILTIAVIGLILNR